MRKILDAIQYAIGTLCVMSLAGIAEKCEHGGTIRDAVITLMIVVGVLLLDVAVYKIRHWQKSKPLR